MKAALIVWWTFFTVFPVQRKLAIGGAVLCVLFVASGIAARQAFWGLGPLALFIFVAVPAVIASGGIFRALSARRMHQLLPHFRLRMLAALGLLVAAVLVSFMVFVWAPQFVDRWPVSAFGVADLAVLAAVFLIWPFVYLTAAFLVFFFASGDWRWTLAVPAAALALASAGADGRAALAAANIVWLAAAVIGWAVFATWYLRARAIGPVVFTPRPPAASPNVDFVGPIGRDAATRALLAARLPQPLSWLRNLGVLGLFFGIVILLAALTPSMRTFPFTTFMWPFAFMGLLGGVVARIVHRSRLLWLRVPDTRQAVRREVERALWRSWAAGLSLLTVIAAVYASPLGGASSTQVLLGFALAAAGGLYGAYVALASVPSIAIQLWGFGLMGAAYLALLSRAAPSPTVVLAITAAELLGAVVLRALAVRRWETIDWLRVRPIEGVEGALQ